MDLSYICLVKLLILTQYFPPEVGAPQNRLYELAVRLNRQGIDVTVLTAMPNYPQMEIYAPYQGKNYVYEEMDCLKIHRASIFVSRKKSIIPRLRNYFSFVVSSALTGRRRLGHFDFLLCESPPLFLGYSAMYLARKKKAKLIFNVSDLWPESAEKLGVVTNKQLLAMAYRLEARLYRKSVLVTGQTQGICESIHSRFPQVKTYWLPNGVDLSYYDPEKIQPGNWRQELGFSDSDLVLMYAGIIGIAQGLEIILQAAHQLRNHSGLKFVLMGSGPEKPRLMALKEELQLTNVVFLEPVTKKQMPEVLKNINAAIIPLRKLELFLGAIPSKLFENLAMEIPVLLGVDGEAKKLFIDQGKSGLFFEPENVRALCEAIQQLVSKPELAVQLGKNGRTFVNEHFNRENIAAGFHQELQKL